MWIGIDSLTEAASCCIPMSWQNAINKFFWREKPFQEFKGYNPKRVYQLQLFPEQDTYPALKSLIQIGYNWRQNLSTENYIII